MLPREHQHEEESQGILDYLSADVILILCQYLDPVSLLCVSLSNHEFNFLAKINWVWSPKLKQAYPETPGSSQYISQVMHDDPDKFSFRLFSHISADMYAGLDHDEIKCFMLVRANDLLSIKANKIHFNLTLLKKKDANKNILIDLIIRNKNPGLNEYVFDCLNNNIGNIKYFLQYGVILNQGSDLFLAWLSAEQAFNIYVDDETLLNTAAKYNSMQSAQLLLTHGANVEKESKKHHKPLYIAAQYGHLDMVKLLVAYGASLNEENSDAHAAIMVAAKQGKYDVVKYLYECGARIHEILPNRIPALYLAMQGGHAKIVDFILEREGHTISEYRSLPYLYAGVKHGHVEAVNVLLQYLKNNNLPIDMTDTPVFNSVYACAEYNHPGLCQLLLENGLSVEGLNLPGKDSPLNCAVNKGHYQVVEVLCQFNPDYNRMLPDGGTALYTAVKKNKKALVNLLCTQGRDAINVDCICINQYTPLCRAALTGYIEIAELLIHCGANVNHRTRNQSTPLYLAASGAHVNIVKLLLSNGADANALGPNDATPLHAICRSKQSIDKIITIIQALIKAGANPLPCFILQLKPSQVAVHKRVVNTMEKLEYLASSFTANDFSYHANISLENKLKEINKDVFASGIVVQEYKVESFKYLFDNINSHFGKAVLIYAYLNMDTKDQLSKSLVYALGFHYTFKARNELQAMLRACLGNDNTLYDLLVKLVINPVSMNLEHHMSDTTLPVRHVFAEALTCLNYVESYLNVKIQAIQQLADAAAEKLNHTYSELLNPSMTPV